MLSKVAKQLQAFADKLTYRHWIIISAIISIFLGILLFMSVKNATKPVEQTTAVNNVQVVVAKRDIPAKGLIAENMLEMRQVPSNILPADAITNMKEAINTYSKVAIMQNDILSKRKIITNMRMASFTGEIPEDCRAVTIGISDVTGVAGFAQPGDRVDIMLVGQQEGKMLGRVLLQNVQLLAINKVQENSGADANKEQANGNTPASAPQKASPIASPATATLALSPADTLKLVTESQDSQIYLALRPFKPKDEFVTKTYHVHYSDFQKMNAPQRASIPTNIPQEPFSNPATVEVIRGTAITRE